jgi:glutamate/tyrosine decarboxylase-like PLP-dependent enzyme
MADVDTRPWSNATWNWPGGWRNASTRRTIWRRLTDVQLNVVCFRYRPTGVPEEELDALNQRLGEVVLADGRVYVGTTTYGGRVAFRPAIVNYRSTEADVDLLVDVIRELGASLIVAERRR